MGELTARSASDSSQIIALYRSARPTTSIDSAILRLDRTYRSDNPLVWGASVFAGRKRSWG